MSAALDYAQARAKRNWDYTHSRGPLAWLFRCAGAMNPVRAVWIRRYADGDWATAHCKGEAIQTWKYDANGLMCVDDIPELDRASAIASTTPVISFCVNDASNRMIYQEWQGVRAGYGCILARKTNGEWVTEKHGWKS